jgi:drug/metabolite transporter (DMT)-like permease
VLLPMVWRTGWAAWRPHQLGGRFWRGAVHTLGLCLWFREPMRWERWLATVLGFAGVLVVVGPKLGGLPGGGGGLYHLAMLVSAPVFAASFLITKALTRTDSASVIILWQAITVTLFSLPLALLNWAWPSGWQWLGFAVCGLLGSAGHYCLTRSFAATDISATQSAKFLDLVWAALMGWLLFADVPTAATLIGGALTCGATIWVARRESRAMAVDNP